MTNKTWILTAAVCCLTSLCQAEPGPENDTGGDFYESLNTWADERKPFTVTFYWDNDGSILKRNNGEDRYYTNGNAVTFAHQPDWAQGFVDIATLGETFDRAAAGYIIGHLVFTPDDISATRLLRRDRPYAGYLFGGVYLQRANETTFDHAQLDIGVVGPSSQADHFQKDIHEWLDLDEPMGWDNQLGDEVTAQLFLRRKWRTEAETLDLGSRELSHQWVPQVELAVGSVYRHAGAGVTWRIGHNLPDDFGPGRLNDVTAATGQASTGGGGYGFIRVAGRAVEHNLFLEGNSYKDSHGVDGETLVGEIQAGLDVYYHADGWKLQAGYSQTFVSEEFDGQDGSMGYGSLMLSASRGF